MRRVGQRKITSYLHWAFFPPTELLRLHQPQKTHCSILPPRITHQPSSKHNRPSISVRAKSEEDIRRIRKLYYHAIRLHNEGLKPEQSHPGPRYTGEFGVAQREEVLKVDKKTFTKLAQEQIGEMTFGQDESCGLRMSSMSFEHSEAIKKGLSHHSSSRKNRMLIVEQSRLCCTYRIGLENWSSAASNPLHPTNQINRIQSSQNTRPPWSS